MIRQKAAKDIPEPIVFGPDFPSFKMLMRRGRQVFESRTNQNLFLDPIFDFDPNGTFTFGEFLRRLGTWRDCLPLLFEDYYVTDEGELFDWTYFAAVPRWDACQPIQQLHGYCRSRSQSAFLRKYLESQYRVGLPRAWDEWHSALNQRALALGVPWRSPVTVVGSEGFVWRLVDLLCGFPAPIPEVWLNYVGYDKTIEDEAHLAANPQRVDFVILADGQKCVVEIDGPSHYADYDETTKTYTVNEDRYAKNLLVERSLRRHGWEIYRFANVEVDRAADDSQFIKLAEHLPGFTSDSYMGRLAFTADEITSVLGALDRFLVPGPR